MTPMTPPRTPDDTAAYLRSLDHETLVRITTRCMSCPPDPRPDDQFCARELTLERDPR